MIDPTPNETTAFVRGGDMGGEYLDSIGKTDLERLSRDEWLTFLDVALNGTNTRGPPHHEEAQHSRVDDDSPDGKSDGLGIHSRSTAVSPD